MAFTISSTDLSILICMYNEYMFSYDWHKRVSFILPLELSNIIMWYDGSFSGLGSGGNILERRTNATLCRCVRGLNFQSGEWGGRWETCVLFDVILIIIQYTLALYIYYSPISLELNTNTNSTHIDYMHTPVSGHPFGRLFGVNRCEKFVHHFEKCVVWISQGGMKRF